MEMESLSDEFRRMFISNLHANNDNVIKGIKDCIERGYFIHVNGKRFSFPSSSKITHYLLSLIKEVRRVTSMFDEYNVRHSPYVRMPVEAYQRLIATFYAVTIFNGDMLNTSARSLFLKPSPGTTLFTGGIGEELFQLQRGGGTGEDATDIKYNSNSRFDFTDINEVDMYEPGDHTWDYPSHILTENALYKILRARYPDKTKDTLCCITEEIHVMLYCYFTYLGCSTADIPFLTTIVDLYENGTFGLLSYTEFEELYVDMLGGELEIYDMRIYFDDFARMMREPSVANKLPYVPRGIAAHGGRRRTRKNRVVKIVK